MIFYDIPFNMRAPWCRTSRHLGIWAAQHLSTVDLGTARSMWKQRGICLQGGPAAATWRRGNIPMSKTSSSFGGGNFGDLQNGWFDGLFHGKSIYKWKIWGYHHLWKAPFIEYGKIGMNQVQMSHSERGVPIFAWPERCWDIFWRFFWFMKGIQKIDIWLWLFFWTRTAWWFGTWILFFPYIGRNFIISTDFHIFQRGRYTTNQRNAWHVVTLSVRHPCPMSPKKTETWRFLRPGTLGRVKNRFGKPERFEMMRFEI